MPDPFSVGIGIAITAFYNYLHSTRISRRFWIRNCLTTNFPKKSEPVEYVSHPSMEHYVEFALNQSRSSGSMQVVGAPLGSGKTTIICEAVQQFAIKYNVPYYYFRGSSAIGKNRLHEFLGLKELENISDFVPKGTIFVLDQVDVCPDEILADQRNYMIDLATDGSNNDAFTLIVCVSNADVFAAMSQYNGGQKVMAMCNPTAIKWDSDALRTYIDRKYHRWSQHWREYVSDSCMVAPTPGLADAIFGVLSRERAQDPTNISENAGVAIRSYITTMVNKWGEFEGNHTRGE